MPAPLIVGVDGSADAVAAVAWAADAATRFDRPVIVAYAFEPPVPIVPAPAPTLPSPYNAEWQSDMRTLLDNNSCRPLRDANASYTIELLAGEPGAAICELATSTDAALVVVGRRGRGVLRELFLGSVSHYLGRHAPCPVVIVPPE